MSQVRDYIFSQGRAFTVSTRNAGPLGRVFAAVIALLVLVIVILLAIPVLALGVIGALGYVAYAKTRALFARAYAPNGVLDGRRNVKVIERRDGE
jgi:nitrate reductase NapE component